MATSCSYRRAPARHRPLAGPIVSNLGRVTYRYAGQLQKGLAVHKEGRPDRADHLLLMEFDPVVTIGRGGALDQLKVGADRLEKRGIKLVFCERGGGATFHGPGQLVAYPVIDLSADRDLHVYLRKLERVMERTAFDFNIDARPVRGLTGLWSDGKKIGAIGISVKKWIAMHGFSLNVSTGLSNYDLITQCGLTGVEPTSMERELGTAPDMSVVADRLVANFNLVFEREDRG